MARFACDICMEAMRFREIETHKKTAHADILRQLAAHQVAKGQRYLRIVVLPMLGLVALMLFAVLSGAWTAPWWGSAVAVFLDAMFGLAAAGILYAERVPAPIPNSFEEVQVRCWICDVKTTRKAVRDHIATLHSDEARYLRTSAYLVWGFLLGWFALTIGTMNLLLFQLLPDAVWDWMLYFVFGPFAAFVLGAILWGLVGHPRHTARAREKWFGQRPRKEREGSA